MRDPWIALALACFLILGGEALRRFWWSEQARTISGRDEARLAYRHHDWAAAEGAARALLRKNRQDPVAIGLLARALNRQGRDRAAKALIERIPEGNWEAEDFFLVGQAAIRANEVRAAIDLWREGIQLEPEPAPFVGEAKSAPCRVDIARDHHRSRHARTFFFSQELPAIPYPQGAIADPQNALVTHEFVTRTEGLEIKTRMENDVYHTIVDYAFGSGDRGLTLVGHDPGQRSLEYRLSFHPDRVGWDVTTGQVPTPNATRALYQGKPLSADDVRDCMNCPPPFAGHVVRHQASRRWTAQSVASAAIAQAGTT